MITSRRRALVSAKTGRRQRTRNRTTQPSTTHGYPPIRFGVPRCTRECATRGVPRPNTPLGVLYVNRSRARAICRRYNSRRINSAESNYRNLKCPRALPRDYERTCEFMPRVRTRRVPQTARERLRLAEERIFLQILQTRDIFYTRIFFFAKFIDIFVFLFFLFLMCIKNWIFRQTIYSFRGFVLIATRARNFVLFLCDAC